MPRRRFLQPPRRGEKEVGKGPLPQIHCGSLRHPRGLRACAWGRPALPGGGLLPMRSCMHACMPEGGRGLRRCHCSERLWPSVTPRRPGQRPRAPARCSWRVGPPRLCAATQLGLPPGDAGAAARRNHHARPQRPPPRAAHPEPRHTRATRAPSSPLAPAAHGAAAAAWPSRPSCAPTAHRPLARSAAGTGPPSPVPGSCGGERQRPAVLAAARHVARGPPTGPAAR
mmetsp:Transcript_66529/g.210317  ORF Transcript_66529/g.210317 Transcript_66529/m.210317 type:complete len:227 (+) Transcript_66529:1742-2422(+)